MYDGINMTGVAMQNPSMTWEFVDRLRKATPLKIFIKGIDTREDARLAVEHGMDGILVSNHGGRSTDGDWERSGKWASNGCSRFFKANSDL
jgi:isopentenyl diphosphate isomerase/L-lactate dehydrogenase-like FMN-dependent dehydrogenase